MRLFLPMSFFQCLLSFFFHPSDFTFHSYPLIGFPNFPVDTPTALHAYNLADETILPSRLIHLDPDPNSLSRPTQMGSKPLNPLNPLNVPYSARSGGGGGGGGGGADAAIASASDRAPRVHHSSTVLMLENALAAMRNDASQLPLSDLVHASTMIRDLENMLRERLNSSLGDDREMDCGTGATVEKE